MARLRVFKANGGKVIDLIKYKQDKQKLQVQEEIRLSREKLNKAKIGKYTDAWKHSTITVIHGKRTGLYQYFKIVNNL